MNALPTDRIRFRCPHAIDPAHRGEHLAFDLLVPCPAEAMAQVAKAPCPCGGRMVALAEEAREAWEGGDWAGPHAEADAADAADAAENALPPEPPPTEVEVGPVDLVEAYRAERHARYAAELAREEAQDLVTLLARVTLDHAPERFEIARGALGLDDKPVLTLGLTKPETRPTGVEIHVSMHWAVHLMAVSFGRTLGKAVNYMETRYTDLGAPGGRRTYIVTVQRLEKITPHEARREAEALRDLAYSALRTLVEALPDEALALVASESLGKALAEARALLATAEVPR